MPKLESPFVRVINDKGDYVVTDKIAEGMDWVFNDESVMCIEKLHGTNVSIIIQDGVIVAVYNRTERIPFFNKGKAHIIQGLLESYKRGWMEDLLDGQHFGEILGPRINGNPYNLKENLWIPFETFCQKHLRYKKWGAYPKDFNTISNWFQNDLLPLYSLMINNGTKYCEGVVFTHPVTGQMAKLRRDMFSWWVGFRHKEKEAV